MKLKKTDVKIGSPRQMMWQQVIYNAEESIKNAKFEIELNKELLVVAKKRVELEKRKFK